VKVRYSEVVRSILYAPAYAAMTKCLFGEAGLDVTLTTAQGGGKSVTALLSNSADIALIGPETTIYVQNSEPPTKMPIFCGLTATDGFVLVGREKMDKFDWQQLKGKQIFALRPGSTPDLFLESALRQNGIDPIKDVKLVNNVTIPARMGAWLAGQNQYAIFTESDASQLELDGKAHFLASIGQTVGYADCTSFMATDKYIRDNPEPVQRFGKGKKMLSKVLIAIAALGTLPCDASAMSVKFSWTGYRACSSRSPAFSVSDVPAETARLAFRMVDKDVPSYPHGGGTVAYRGQGEIPAGAFSYKGPCPPSGQHHTYEWTVQALGQDGKAIGSATVAGQFPPH